MRRDDRLPRPRTALDHQHSGQAGPDDPVLLRLDGGDDVPHPPRPARAECGQQRRFPVETAALCVTERIEVEDVVVDADDTPALRPQLPSPQHALRVCRRGAMEPLDCVTPSRPHRSW